MLKPVISLEVYANALDPFEGSLGATIPADKLALNRDCIVEAGNVVNLASGCIWESCACAMPCVRDVSIEIEVQTEMHHFKFEFDILSNETTFESWSPELHDNIDRAKKQLRSIVADMLYDLAIDYYGLDTERRANHAYTICRRN